MGLVRSAARASAGSPSGLASPEKWVVDWFAGGADTTAGVHVSEDTALHYGPYFAGVRMLSEDVGKLPLPLYRRLRPRGKQRAAEHPLYRLLHDQPNPMMGSMTLRETLQGHALTWGGGFGYIVRNNRGNAVEVWPLRPDRMRPKMVWRNIAQFDVEYRYDDPINNIRVTLTPSEVLHIAGFGFDGVRGYSAVAMARNTIALGLATETYGGAFFRNGSRPGGVLTHPKTVSDDARKRMKADWENLHRGLDRAQRLAILEEGVTWQAIGIPNNDAQFLETRRFQVTDMARWLRLPPHKLAELERATFSNIEEQGIDYVVDSLQPWLVRWEQAIALRLLTDAERREFFAEHLIAGLLRGDTKTRFEAYAVGRQWGWLSANDIRELENENPVQGGDVYLVPLNMVPANQSTDPAPAPADEPDDDPPRSRRRRRRSIEGRRRIGQAFAPLISDLDLRLAKLERAEVSSLVRRHLGRSAEDFDAAVSALYAGPIQERSLQEWLPLFTTFAAEVAPEAAEEVAAQDETDLSTWVAAYVAGHIAYRMASAVGQLRATVKRNPDDPATAVGDLLDEWVAVRPDRTAKWESNQLPNAAAREVWRAAGIRHITWTTIGETCSYCAELDGRTVGIDEPFLAKGDQLNHDGQALTAKRNIHHPPVHPGCDCSVQPG